MVVQRKWMYLESIFIGGDIRTQLPEEAKKFDIIDKMFKKVKGRSKYGSCMHHRIVEYPSGSGFPHASGIRGSMYT